MNFVSFPCVSSNEKVNGAQSSLKKKSKREQPKNCNWKMSDSFIRSVQENETLQHKSSRTLCNYKDQQHHVCPADIKMLKQYTYKEPKPPEDLEPIDFDDEEHEAHLDSRASDVELPKLKTWDEYKKLVELSRVKPRRPVSKSLMRISSQIKLRIDRRRTYTGRGVKRSALRSEGQKMILVADTNYVQFRNFETKRVYKKAVTLQNVCNRPARFHMERRPSRSKFRIILKPLQRDSGIVSPGMRTRVIVLFRSDEIENFEEILVLYVEHGASLVIRLHAYRDTPVLVGRGCCLSANYCCIDSNGNGDLLVRSWQPEMSSFDTIDEFSVSSSTDSTWSDDTANPKETVIRVFDCNKGFIGEVLRQLLRLTVTSGEGRFCIISETDWMTMEIADITESNTLRLPCFTLQPAYFSLKTNDEINFYMNFTPECYGIHVEKLYILCDNGALVTTEIIGDGLLYESDFIRFSKHMEKAWPYRANVDKRADYYVTISTSVPYGTGQCVISVSNVSEICVHYHWKKRNVRTEIPDINEENYFPLELLRVEPERGIFKPTSVHNFTVTAKYADLQPNYYFAVLQLYVEDIPEEAISEKRKFKTEMCGTRRRKCSSSVDVWVADVEILLRYLMDDETETDRSSELLKRITEVPSDYENYEEGQYDEETMEDIYYIAEQISACQLVAEELFSYHDLVNLSQFESLWQARVIGMGIIRPTRALYIGIEETFHLTLKNLSTKTLDYSWGEISGLDSMKMKFRVQPERGEILPGRTQNMEVAFVPIQEGIVQSLFIPCFVGNSKRILMLGIECFVEALHVIFYFPLSYMEPATLKSNFLQVEWRVDSLKHALDMAGKSKRHMKLLERYKTRDEEELMSMNLDQGEVLKDASVGPSMLEVVPEESGEESASTTDTSEIIQMSDLIPTMDKCSQNIASSGSVIPFFNTFFPLPTQPIVIEFLKLSLKTMEKKTFLIKNETAIATNFWIRLKNFYPITCSCEWKTQEDQIKFMYKRTFGRHKGIIEETLYKVKQPEAGVVIYVYPLNSDIGPFTAVPIDIYVFADTWGVYVDELEININSLPQYTVGIYVQVIGSPISFSISDKSESNIPVIKYGIRTIGTSLQDRKVVLKNTSAIPVAIDWHSFLVKPAMQVSPFNVAFDFCTPLTDKLAAKLKTSKDKNNSEIHLEKHANSQCIMKLLHSCNSIDISDVTDITSSTCLDSSSMAMSWVPDNKTLCSTEVSNKSISCSSMDNSECTSACRKNKDTSDKNDAKEEEDIELKISILPYYGLIDTKLCTVTPKEMFILPKSAATLAINIQLDRFKVTNATKRPLEGEFFCKILGLLRIAPTDMYKDNRYVREIGPCCPPIEIDITANIIKPKLEFNIPKSERTYVCSVDDVIYCKKKIVVLYKTFIFHNNENSNVEIAFETCHPFHVASVLLNAETNPCKSGTMCINANGSAKVEIKCVVNADLICTILHTTSSQQLNDSKIILREPLYIIYSDKEYQVMELILQILLPVLKLSSYALDFGLVYIGDTKKLTLSITNSSMPNVKFKVKHKYNNEDYTIDKKCGLLSSCSDRQDWTFAITVSFEPKIPGQSFDTLEIITGIPYCTEECQLYGEGTLDEKYHTPGV